MLRNVSQPLNPGRFQPNVEINASRHRLMDDDLLLLFQKLDELLLRADVPADLPVGMVEETNDGECSSIDGKQL